MGVAVGGLGRGEQWRKMQDNYNWTTIKAIGKEGAIRIKNKISSNVNPILNHLLVFDYRKQLFFIKNVSFLSSHPLEIFIPS